MVVQFKPLEEFGHRKINRQTRKFLSLIKICTDKTDKIFRQRGKSKASEH